MARKQRSKRGWSEMCWEEAKREREGRKRMVARGRGGENTSHTADRKGSVG